MLTAHQQQVADLRLRDVFERDPGRAKRFSLELEGLFIDFSKNLITDETLSLLLGLAEECELEKKLDELFKGYEVNNTEKRPALHTLLRAPENFSLFVDGVDLSRQVQDDLDKMFKVVNDLHEGQIKGATGKAISRVVNIGIGGSDLGPRLVDEALSEFRHDSIEIDFVANIDPFDIERVLNCANPETTLFIIASKSFTTPETLTNANRAKSWLIENGCDDTGKHFMAVSENAAAVERFGIDERYYFKIRDWVGGRYSIWSCIGMIAAIGIGEDNFKRFLAGAHALDSHFRSAEFNKNIPVILALLSIWYNNFFDVGTHAIIPYDQKLQGLPAYLSQLVMESNGKSVNADGSRSAVNTSQVIWGGIGSNSQHAFFQFLHQGARMTSIDFLLPLGSRHDPGRHGMLAANCFAQSEALMQGKTNHSEPHRNFDGNKPSTTILYDQLDPYALGMLLAVYEHKTFVEAGIWGINPFDQWGVELGKKLAERIFREFEAGGINQSHDASTASLMNKYLSKTNRPRTD